MYFIEFISTDGTTVTVAKAETIVTARIVKYMLYTVGMGSYSIYTVQNNDTKVYHT
jgi:hypothetical protein